LPDTPHRVEQSLQIRLPTWKQCSTREQLIIRSWNLRRARSTILL
jgi:hypothetical protein